ncbi:MAG: AAA family ATPase, partial [Gemmataceae bacterium]
LTILAGANSSGKSSMMQPLLLLKQTLEAPYDPGPLLLNGPNVKFTSAEQLLSRIGRGRSLDSFQVRIRLDSRWGFVTSFRKENRMGFRIAELEISGSSGQFTLKPEMTPGEIVKTGITEGFDEPEVSSPDNKSGQWQIEYERCFLELYRVTKWPNRTRHSHRLFAEIVVSRIIIPEVIHLPGLRGNPERTYPVTAVGPNYPGTFDKYTASVISQWKDENEAVLAKLNEDLKLLKLTGGVSAVPVNAVQIELQVGRLPDVPPTRPEYRVNIADVGVGVSQTLPVLVALHAAKPGQLVYVEQPETHLHPRAQFALAQILASAAKRGVRVVVETHSSILLLGVQTLVAEGSLEPDKVKLHWFQREKDGRTTVRSADLDEAGAFGDWPEDFDDIILQTQAQYLDAASARRLRK